MRFDLVSNIDIEVTGGRQFACQPFELGLDPLGLLVVNREHRYRGAQATQADAHMVHALGIRLSDRGFVGGTAASDASCCGAWPLSSLSVSAFQCFKKIERRNAAPQTALELEKCINSDLDPYPGDSVECVKGWKQKHCNRSEDDPTSIGADGHVNYPSGEYCRYGRKQGRKRPLNRSGASSRAGIIQIGGTPTVRGPRKHRGVFAPSTSCSPHPAGH
jgi:hypothetical protein